MRQRRQRAVLVGLQEQPGPEKCLKAIADAEDELVAVAERAEGVVEKHPQLVGQNLSAGHIVAVREAAGDYQDLVLVEQPRVFAQAVDVDPFGGGAGLLEGELRFSVAVGAGCSEDQNAWLGHS